MIIQFKGQVKRGFTLLEMTIVIIILTIVAATMIPSMAQQYTTNAANKTALDISAIEEASRAFYVANNKWPDASVYATPIAALQAGASPYLPSSWSAVNPFGASSVTPSTYAYTVTSNGNLLTVSTMVPAAAQPIIQNLLPATAVVGNAISSSVTIPGTSSSLPSGAILSWAGNNLPSGYLWCNGQSVSRTTYSGLYAVIGTTYGVGDGLTTFNLPDLMGRTVVGVDGMGGAGAANRITQWGSLPAQMAATFGEDAHRQTVAQIAPHSFDIPGNILGIPGPNGDLFRSDNLALYNWDYHTNTIGGNGDGTGLGAPSNVVQPSMAMGCIIKT